jgi:hypothetical protein
MNQSFGIVLSAEYSKMRIRSVIAASAVFLSVACGVVFTTGCSLDPLKFASRNACEFLNCDVLFFVDDLLPLSGGPVEGGAAAAPDEGGGGGGH